MIIEFTYCLLTFEQLKSYNRLYAKRVLNWSKSVCDLFGQINRTA